MKSKEFKHSVPVQVRLDDIKAGLVFPGRMQELSFRKEREIVKDTKSPHI